MRMLCCAGTEFAETSQGSHEPSSVPAVHADLAVPAHAPSPPVQVSQLSLPGTCYILLNASS